MSWDLHVTVAAIVERAQRFLFVEERIDGHLRLNQPAGHLEANESLQQAVIRETFEETACRFEPHALVGIYLWSVPNSPKSYLRVAFCGNVQEPDPNVQLDQGIERTLWLDRTQLLARQADCRSPLVLRCIDDYLAGQRHPLQLLTSLGQADNPP